MKNYEEPKFVLEDVAKVDLLANSNGFQEGTVPGGGGPNELPGF